jgi:putative NIF3 family GTP cyclohydrolase 1 type 2
VPLAAAVPATGLEAGPGVRAAVHGGDELRGYCEEAAGPALSARFAELAPGVTPFVAALRNPGPEAGFGEIGDLPRAVSPEVFLKKLSALAGRRHMTLCGPRPERIRRVAYCPGSGASVLERAFARGADVFVTGDMKYHAALEAPGLVVDVGHFCLEEEMMRRFAADLAGRAKGVTVRFFEGADPFRTGAPRVQGNRAGGQGRPRSNTTAAPGGAARGNRGWEPCIKRRSNSG